MRAWLKERIRRARIWWGLRVANPYPEMLPNPPLGTIGPRQQAAIDGLETVGIFLGPYRNLTTLSAAILYLHPECQVLNHAGPRVLKDPALNFLTDYEEDKFRAFCHFGLTMSQGGARGSYGGSVLLAHAYADHGPMRRAYLQRFGATTRKPEVKSLVWKESQRVTHLLRSDAADLEELLARNARLRFLLPIRNPIDCAHSLARLGMTRVYGEQTQGQVLHVLDMILDDMHWFLEWQVRYPRRFFHFYQNQLNADTLNDLAAFLKLSQDQRWVGDTLSIYRLRPPYEYEQGVRAHYQQRVEQLFGARPDILEDFLSFSQPLERELA